MNQTLLFPVISTLFILVVYVAQAQMVSAARLKYKIKAPKTQGHDEFEKTYRAHLNTMEQLVLVLPTMWFFALLVSANAAGILGILWGISRIVYAYGYAKNNTIKLTGGIVGAVISLIFLLGAAYGAMIGLLN
jgi:glutathione S-transferase